MTSKMTLLRRPIAITFAILSQSKAIIQIARRISGRDKRETAKSSSTTWLYSARRPMVAKQSRMNYNKLDRARGKKMHRKCSCARKIRLEDQGLHYLDDWGGIKESNLICGRQPQGSRATVILAALDTPNKCTIRDTVHNIPDTWQWFVR